ncbi:MAG TPA: response regulator [Thermodesulfobacteriota bacterium]|nr:response regulator [Thermodesulfobacteriota bacterium]
MGDARRPHRILVVDDEPDLVELVAANLRRAGFAVEGATSGARALARLGAEPFDLVILDLMLPDVQGLEVCRALRRDPRTARLPVIMLTARGEEAEKLAGFEAGADDYVTKPFSPRELTARVKARLREAAGAGEAERYERGGLVVDFATYRATRDGRPLALRPTEFRLLKFFVTHPERVYTRAQLLDLVWGEAFVEPRTVDVHIKRLRAQLEENPAEPKLLVTVRGVGYMFVPPPADG